MENLSALINCKNDLYKAVANFKTKDLKDPNLSDIQTILDDAFYLLDELDYIEKYIDEAIEFIEKIEE